MIGGINIPIYEFRCQHCGHVFDELCSVGTNEMKCPQCCSISTKSSGGYMSNSTGLPNGFASTRSDKRGKV